MTPSETPKTFVDANIVNLSCQCTHRSIHFAINEIHIKDINAIVRSAILRDHRVMPQDNAAVDEFDDWFQATSASHQYARTQAFTSMES